MNTDKAKDQQAWKWIQSFTCRVLGLIAETLSPSAFIRVYLRFNFGFLDQARGFYSQAFPAFAPQNQMM